MKKYISLLLATAATIACTKVALDDNSPIESLPQDGNTENIQGEPSGEKIIISLAETKVSLDENRYYQFDGDEIIYVKARSTEAVAKLQNSADEKNTFTGVFNGILGKDSETFDFYYNCTDENAKVVKVQNGQPWLAATGVVGNRSEGSEYSYELSDVMLKQLDGYVCLALNSDYACTVDFHTLTTALPNGETTISGIQLGSGSKKPYFVNIASGMTGGFYLAVNKTGETGTMYTSYGTSATINANTSATIDANTSVKVKAFTPMKISGSLTGFETTYDLYKTKGADAANSESNDYMAGGNLKISVQGISNSLLSLDSITITSSDGKTIGSSTSQPEWSNKEYTWNFNDASKHTTWGELTVTATAVFNTPAGKVTAEVPALSRHITGLPYEAIPPTEANGWSVTRGVMGLTKNVVWQTNGVKLKGARDSSGNLKPLIQSPSFHLPNNEELMITSNLSYILRSFTFWGKTYTTTMTFWISGTNKLTKTTQSTSDEPHSDSGIEGTLTSTKKYVEFEAYSSGTGAEYDAYAIIKGIELYYR